MTQRTDLVIVVPALVALRAYINEHYGGSVAAFSRENKLDGGEIGRILRQTKNRGQRVTVAFADKIEKATQGRVGIRMWLPVVRRVA